MNTNSSRVYEGSPPAAAYGDMCPAKRNLVSIVVAFTSLATAFAFCPTEMRPRTTLPMGVKSSRQSGSLDRLCRQRIFQSSALLSTNDDDVKDAINRIMNEDPAVLEPELVALNEEDEDGTEEDTIVQKLRGHAKRGPINPMREHDKMVKENEEEALYVTSSQTSSRDSEESLYNSPFYRRLMASYVAPSWDISDSYHDEYVDNTFDEMLSRDGARLSKLGPGVSTEPLDPNSDEAKVEKDLAKKEAALQRVAKQIDPSGERNWDRDKIDEAERLKYEIDRMHIDDCGDVLIANLAFYEAFSARDFDWMNEVWWDSPSVICIHPSHNPLVGSKAVLDNFKQMFGQELVGKDSRGGGTEPSPNAFMNPANIRALSVRGTTASLVCDEEIFDKDDFGSGRFVINKLLTTNVFRKIGGRWKMVHRHASFHPETLAAEAASKAKFGFVPVKSERAKFNEKLEEKRMRIKRLHGGGTSIRPAAINSPPKSLDGLRANNVMGIPDIKVPKKKRKKDSSDQNDLMKILGIGQSSSEDDYDDDDNDDEDADDDGESSRSSKSKKFSLSDLLSAGGQGKTTTTGSGTPEDPYITRRVIHIGPEQIEKLAADGAKLAANEEDDEGDDSDEDEDDDDENVVIDLRDKTEEERKKILADIFPDQVESLMESIRDSERKREEEGKSEETMTMNVEYDVNSKHMAKKLKSAAAEVMPAPFIKPKESKQSMTQKCIDTIRKLSGDGQISSKQKTVLLTDIIASSARGETSMIEVAYSLLLSDDSEPGMEDFTEQCRVFASASIEENEI